MTEAQKLVGVLMGSASDFEVMRPAIDTLRRFEVPHEVEVASAHRTPEIVREYASTAAERGLRVLIVGAGGAAHLAGVVAAHCILPVLAVPVNATALRGMDALLASVQMPTGIPVACLAIDGSANAALKAVSILALMDPALTKRLQNFRLELVEKTVMRADKLKRELADR